MTNQLSGFRYWELQFDAEGRAVNGSGQIVSEIQLAGLRDLFVFSHGWNNDTSMAAAFLSIRREFIGHPDDVKRIFTSTATSLGRESYFQGHGLVDLMRAIQSV